MGQSVPHASVRETLQQLLSWNPIAAHSVISHLQLWPILAQLLPDQARFQGLRLRKTSGSEALSVRKSFVVSLTLLLRVIWL
jgi:hypothetical protein